MSDLISRSALMKDIGDTVVFSVRNGPSAEIRGANKILDRIKAAPAVDAVPVVRCGECVYRNGGFCRKNSMYYKAVKLDGFCDRGRRKDNETD